MKVLLIFGFKGLNQIITVLSPFLNPAAKSIVSGLLITRDQFKTK